jgi:hypothetical protein
MEGPLVPAKNFRLVALNQKFQKGAEAKYFLRDMGNKVTQVILNVVGSSASVKMSVDQSLDFQPFFLMDQLKPARSDEAIPLQHGARTEKQTIEYLSA